MLSYRPACPADAAILFEWRNDPLTRAMSRSTEPLHWNQHIAWLNGRLGRVEPSIYVAEKDGHPVGTFRIDGDEVSYTVAPIERGKGIATEMLKLVRNEFGSLRAEIFGRNEASIKAAERAGHIVVLLS